jgi:hypothetical protein
MRKAALYSIFSLCALLAACPARAGLDEPIYVIDSPTAGLLANGEYLAQGRIGPESSIQLGMRIGFFDVLQLGTSFGMQRVFERDDVSVNDQVGFYARVRILEELSSPALAFGFDSQGVGRYDEDLDRYERKSPGFYGVLSKNWLAVVGDISLHGGINYSLEDGDDDGGINLFAASDWMLVRGFSLLLDGNAALNDNKKDGRYGGGGVYLDGAVRLSYGENLSMMLIFRDLTGNFEPDKHVAREFELALVNSF